MGRVERLNSLIKRFDSALFVKSMEGKLCVFRKGKTVDSFWFDDCLLHFIRPAPFFIFALTHNWRLDGDAADWGIEPILEKLRFGDLWNRDLVSEIEKNDEKIHESAQRAIRSESEAWAIDNRRRFAKASDDVLTHSLENVDRRKTDEKFKEI